MDKVVTNIDDGCRDKVCHPLLKKMGVERPRAVITILFLISTVLVFVAFIVGIVVASDIDAGNSEGSDSSFAGSLTFAAIFSTLLYIALSVTGTMILRKYKTPLSIGAFIGFVFVTANLCLILCAIFANVADVMQDDDHDRPYEAFATFQFFLFTVYSVFGVTLTVFRNEVIEVPNYEDDYAEHDMPLDQGGGGGSSGGGGAVPDGAEGGGGDNYSGEFEDDDGGDMRGMGATQVQPGGGGGDNQQQPVYS